MALSEEANKLVGKIIELYGYDRPNPVTMIAEAVSTTCMELNLSQVIDKLLANIDEHEWAVPYIIFMDVDYLVANIKAYRKLEVEVEVELNSLVMLKSKSPSLINVIKNDLRRNK